MHLHLLRQSACLSIYYDSHNDWLYLDWKGELTLTAVQVACAELGACFLHRPYARVLNSNLQVTNVHWAVAAWLACEFLPHVKLAGIEHIAWICSPSLRGRNMVQTVMNWLPQLTVTLFDDMDEAVYSLQKLRPQAATGYILPQRPAATQATLAQVVQVLRHKASAPRAKMQRI